MSTENKLTAMQELIELRNKSFDVIKFVKWFDENKNYILEKEKQQIIDSCIETTQGCWGTISEEFKILLTYTEEDLQNQKEEAEQYYNEKYKK